MDATRMLRGRNRSEMRDNVRFVDMAIVEIDMLDLILKRTGKPVVRRAGCGSAC